MAAGQILDARHATASAAGSIARVAAQVARALAWDPTPARAAAFLSDIDTAIDTLRAAEAELVEARAMARVATRDASKRSERRRKSTKE